MAYPWQVERIQHVIGAPNSTSAAAPLLEATIRAPLAELGVATVNALCDQLEGSPPEDREPGRILGGSGAALDFLTVLGGVSGFTAWLFAAVLPLDWPAAVAAAAAIAAISGLLAAWAGGCDLFGYTGPRLTLNYPHSRPRYSYDGVPYPTFACWG
jgi:hypothetical protein